MNIAMNPTRNNGSDSIADAQITTRVPTARPMNVYRVTFAPPIRSDNHPPGGRAKLPSSGPRNVNDAACNGVRPNWFCNTNPNAKLYPMNEPNVPMYRNDITHVCRCANTSFNAPVSLRAVVRLSMNNAATTAASTINGMYTYSTYSGLASPHAPITNNPTSCTTATPRLPPPAFNPNANPLRPSGYNALILAIDEAKFP